jgi:hypothetical protein
MEELDRALDPAGDRVGHFDHDRHVLRLDAMLIGRAAVAKVVAELDRGGHRVADLGQYADCLVAEIDRPRFVIAFPGQNFLAHVPLHGEAIIGYCRGDPFNLADEMRCERG